MRAYMRACMCAGVCACMRVCVRACNTATFAFTHKLAIPFMNTDYVCRLSYIETPLNELGTKKTVPVDQVHDCYRLT